jgi:tRNA threonylcarbamoyladenosine biosynthesis protein TsaE
LYHIDSYRLNGTGDAWSIGLEDIVYGDDVTVIEWAENVSDLLPDDCLWIKLTMLENGDRRLLFRAEGEQSQVLLNAFRERALGRC